MHSVRKATAADTDTLSQLYRDCLESADWFLDKNSIDFTRDTQGEAIWVALDEQDQPVGFISVWMPESFIHHLYVASTQRGQGVGSSLISALEGQVPLPWRLKCSLANTPAREFYLKHGWKTVEVGQGKDGTYWLMELSSVL